MRIKELQVHLWRGNKGFLASVHQGDSWGTDLFDTLKVRPQSFDAAQSMAKLVLHSMGLEPDHIKFTEPPQNAPAATTITKRCLIQGNGREL